MKTFSPTFLIVFLTACYTLAGQTLEQQVRGPLVPYNDHGKWGYADTLGGILIKPQFEEASFFYDSQINGAKQRMAQVTTKHGINYINQFGKLFIPKKLHVERGIYHSDLPGRTHWLVRRKGRYGIWSFDDKYVLKPQYDSLSNPAMDWGLILMKNGGDLTYVEIDPKTGTASPTDITKVERYFANLRGHVCVATRTNGEYYEIRDGALKSISAADLNKMDREDEVYLMEVEDDWDSGPRRANNTTIKEAYDRVIDSRSFTELGVPLNYGFRELYIVAQDGQVGVVNEAGTEILPFTYDTIEFQDSGTQAVLRKGDKVGRKIFFTHHPTIEPKYDRLSHARNIRVSPTWSFGVFSVELN
ncbi:MAG: WG repeat-containing protein, partial [Bacteroidota bacterium]